MKGWLPLALGLLAVVLGALWTLEGLGYVRGSLMTGHRLWSQVGPAVAAVGLLSICLALRARRRRNRP